MQRWGRHRAPGPDTQRQAPGPDTYGRPDTDRRASQHFFLITILSNVLARKLSRDHAYVQRCNLYMFLHCNHDAALRPNTERRSPTQSPQAPSSEPYHARMASRHSPSSLEPCATGAVPLIPAAPSSQLGGANRAACHPSGLRKPVIIPRPLVLGG